MWEVALNSQQEFSTAAAVAPTSYNILYKFLLFSGMAMEYFSSTDTSSWVEIFSFFIQSRMSITLSYTIAYKQHYINPHHPPDI